MPRRLPGLVRGLTSESLASVAYGEVGSSIYFALGIVALYALGLTPWVLLAVGLLFMLGAFPVYLTFEREVDSVTTDRLLPRRAGE